MVQMSDTTTQLLTITDEARARVLEVRGAETDPDALGLWIEVSGVAGTAFTYDMYFRRVDEAGELDIVQHGDDLSVVGPSEHADKIRGSTLDLSGGGMVLQNPNVPAVEAPYADAPDLDLDDPVVAKVVEVLAVQINPQIAAHGGFAELVAVDGSIAYLRMGGRCHVVPGHRGRDPRLRAGDHRGRRRHRPRRRHEPVLPGRQEVTGATCRR